MGVDHQLLEVCIRVKRTQFEFHPSSIMCQNQRQLHKKTRMMN